MTEEEQKIADEAKAKELADAEEAKNKEAKTFTQEDLDKALSERLKRASEKAEKDLAEKLKTERADWERTAKLSADEKKAEEHKRQSEETQKRESEITLRENRADARELLSEKKIPAALVDFVVDVDMAKTIENIDKLEEAYLKAVEEGVNDKLKGQTPKDKTINTAAPQHSGTTVI